MKGGFFYLLDSIRPFLAMAETEQVPLYSFIWLNENVHIHAPFLAMAEKEQVPLYSFGLTKTFSCWKRF